MTTQELLAAVAAGTVSPDKASEMLKDHGGAITFRVGEKGGCCVYGLQRRPVTLYKSQWQRLLEKADDLRKFLNDNEKLLKDKPVKEAA